MNWYRIIKLAAYEQYRDKIEQLSRQNPYPFSSWFDENGRSYIPFELSDPTQMYDNDDEYVVSHLQERGCTDIDYRNGKCVYQGRTYTIGRLLNPDPKHLGTLIYKDLQEIKQKVEADPESIYDVEREIKETYDWYNDLYNYFGNSLMRSNKGQNSFQVVISQNPQDVASMSTDRNWTSCMELGEGSRHEDIFCEVSSGGLVAYLIYGNDVKINNPLARIHIRRFESKQGKSVAIPEKDIYGTKISGFKEVVQQWLAGKQGTDMEPGMYTRMGGEWSDTFGKMMLVAPSTEEGLLLWLTKKDPNSIYTVYYVNDELAEGWNEFVEENSLGEYDKVQENSQKFNTKEEAEEYFNRVSYHTEEDEAIRSQFSESSNRHTYFPWQEEDEERIKSQWEEVDKETGEYELPRYTLRPKVYNHVHDMQRHAIETILEAEKGTYSPEMIQQLHYILFEDAEHDKTTSMTGHRSKFFQKFPEYVSKEDLSQIKDKQDILFLYDRMTPEQQQMIKSEYEDTLFEVLENPEKIISQRFSPSIRDLELRIRFVASNYIISPLRHMYKPIPEPIIQKLVEFAALTPGEEDDLSLIDKLLNKAKKSFLWKELAGGFCATDSDTPTVQRFYQSLLPYWGENHRYYGPTLGIQTDSYSSINLGTLGYYISQLGENGKQFIPFMQKKISADREKLDRVKEEISTDPNAGPKTPIPIKWQNIYNILEQNVESYLYILDYLENGKSSGKYRFHR